MILFLNGPSSVGKTTLAKHLQKALPTPHLHLGVDTFIDAMPEACNDWHGTSQKEGFNWISNVDDNQNEILSINVGPYGQKILQAFKLVTHTLASHKLNLIIDDIALGKPEIDKWKTALKNHNTLFIGLSTPLAVIEQREKMRENRLIGSTRHFYDKVHENVEYDLFLDTYEENLDEMCQKILSKIHHSIPNHTNSHLE